MGCSFDAFPAETVVHWGNHPRRHKHRDELDIPHNLVVLRSELWSDASDLPINYSGV